MLLVLVAAACLALAVDSCDRNARRAGPYPALTGASPASVPRGGDPVPVVRADASGAEALRSIQEQGRREAAALYRSLQRLPDGRDRREVEKTIHQVKHETRQQLLQTRAELARQRGDDIEARRAERQLKLMHGSPPR
jgi:hypothetical protein